MPSATRLRNASITLQDATLRPTLAPHMQYLVYQVEECPSTQKLHLQLYVQYRGQVAFSTVKKDFPKSHIEKSKGSDVDNHAYCTKEATRVEGPWEFGDRKAQGRRADLDAVVECAIKGGLSAVRSERPAEYVLYHRGLTSLLDGRLKDELPSHRTWMTTAEWLHGPTGVGKSHRAFDGYSPATHYLWKLDDKEWQDGYVGQSVVIINDFRGEIKYNTLLNLIDKWPYEVSRRYLGPIQFLARHIILTSSMTPEQVYHNRVAEDKIEQLLRRVRVELLEKYIVDVVQ